MMAQWAVSHDCYFRQLTLLSGHIGGVDQRQWTEVTLRIARTTKGDAHFGHRRYQRLRTLGCVLKASIVFSTLGATQRVTSHVTQFGRYSLSLTVRAFEMKTFWTLSSEWIWAVVRVEWARSFYTYVPPCMVLARDLNRYQYRLNIGTTSSSAHQPKSK